MTDKVKRKILNQRWANLEKMGISRPKDKEEQEKRAKEAHGNTTRRI